MTQKYKCILWTGKTELKLSALRNQTLRDLFKNTKPTRETWLVLLAKKRVRRQRRGKRAQTLRPVNIEIEICCTNPANILYYTDTKYSSERDYFNGNYNKQFSLQLLCKWAIIKNGLSYDMAPYGLKKYLKLPIVLYFEGFRVEDTDTHTVLL